MQEDNQCAMHIAVGPERRNVYLLNCDQHSFSSVMSICRKNQQVLGNGSLYLEYHPGLYVSLNSEERLQMAAEMVAEHHAALRRERAEEDFFRFGARDYDWLDDLEESIWAHRGGRRGSPGLDTAVAKKTVSPHGDREGSTGKSKDGVKKSVSSHCSMEKGGEEIPANRRPSLSVGVVGERGDVFAAHWARYAKMISSGFPVTDSDVEEGVRGVAGLNV